MVHGVVPGNVTSLVKLPSGWMSSGMSVMSPLTLSLIHISGRPQKYGNGADADCGSA